MKDRKGIEKFTVFFTVNWDNKCRDTFTPRLFDVVTSVTIPSLGTEPFSRPLSLLVYTIITVMIICSFKIPGLGHYLDYL